MVQASMQLSLGVGLQEDQRFANFLPGRNSQVAQLLQEQLSGDGFRYVYLWGAADTGKTHLLHACHQMGEQARLACVFLDLAAAGQPVEALAEVDVDLVCIDRLQRVAGQPDWEEALFHLFNRLRERQAMLVITADCAPSGLGMVLPDLVSRLAWGLTYHLLPLQDDEKLAAFRMRAHQRGMELPDEVARYILHRCPRRLSELFATLDVLDEASLNAQRKLTIPFVRSALK